MIFVNFKTYPEATGKKAIDLALACQKAQRATGIAVFLCVEAADIRTVAQAVDLPVWAQHIDPVKPQRATGFITAYQVFRAGAKGTLLNHSEHPLAFAQLKLAVQLAKDEGLKTLVFVKNLDLARQAGSLEPEYLALEEPSLISSGKAMVEVAEEKEKVQAFFKLNLDSLLLIGAGISCRQDVVESVRLGAKGVVVSSAVVLADDPQKVVEDLALGFK